MSTTFPSFAKQQDNLVYGYIAAAGAILQLIIFKFCYPYADFFSDSYSYIFAAARKMDVNIWPVGYSKFLWLFHQISSSDTALVAFQYFFVQGATFYLFLSLRYLYEPSRRTSRIIFICLFFDPLLLYLSNYISSDALFLGLSIWWATTLLWIVHRPTPGLVFVQALLIGILFTLRYNALYYPIVGAIVFFFSRYKIPWKAAGILLPFLFIIAFVQYTRESAFQITGHRQFSIFGGWQLANNALYMYPFIDVQETPPVECREFDTLVKSYFSHASEDMKSVTPREGAYYIRQPIAPLKQYSARFSSEKDYEYNGLISWGAPAPVYKRYGQFLITHHPVAFFRYFILPNILNYLLPPLEKLEVYNLGSNKVSDIAVQWFHYPHHSLHAASWTAQGIILLLFPTIFMLLNLYFIYILIRWIRERKKMAKDSLFDQTVAVVILILLINAGFSILASPVVFRYQVFPMILSFCFLLLIWERVDKALPAGDRRS